MQNSKLQFKIKNLRIKLLYFLLAFLTFNFYLLPSVALAQQATLSLSPSSGTFNKGCNFSLNVGLNTGGAQTDGTDAIIIYDSSRFSATSITSGQIYPDYPGNNINEQTGKITVSGLAAVASAFSGTGTLATINFTVKDNAPEGATQVKFDFDPNDKSKTTDSNVVERGTVADILNSVVNGSYTIGSGVCPRATPKPGVGAPSVATPAATPYVGPQPTLPPAGTETLTYTIAIVGMVLVVLGILGFVVL